MSTDARNWIWRRYYDAVVTVKHTPIGKVRVLTVRRHSDNDGITWDALQAIKNDVLGPDVVAVEVYPAASDLVNEVNARHLWEWPTSGFPFNLNRR